VGGYKPSRLSKDGEETRLLQFWVPSRIRGLLVHACERTGESISSFIRRATWSEIERTLGRTRIEDFSATWSENGKRWRNLRNQSRRKA
jgi:hypothetical protein